MNKPLTAGHAMGSSVSKNDDFNAWLLDQSEALRNRHYGIDWEGIAEELEAMARKDQTSLRSHLQNLLSHLLKWAYEPSHRGPSWSATIDASRDQIEDLLEESPSLRNELAAAFASPKVYRRALRDANRDTRGTVQFPEHCPWTLEEILDPNFLPD